MDFRTFSAWTTRQLTIIYTNTRDDFTGLSTIFILYYKQETGNHNQRTYNQ